ncbi:dTDP-glucose 4,6-dehydratase [Aerococcus urinae]
MTYLITGAAGFIGSNFIRYLINKEDVKHIVILDKLTYAGSLNNLDGLLSQKNITFIHGDICNRTLLDSIFKKYNPKIIINFAAESHVDRSILGDQDFIRTNVFGVQTLMDSAKKAWKNNDTTYSYSEQVRFIQISTDEVYGPTPKNQIFTEDQPLHPMNPYSASKASADLLINSYQNTYNFPAIVIRGANNYGPNQNIEKFIPRSIFLSNANKQIEIYGDGLQTRDWIFVEDFCSAIFLIMTGSRVGEIYNVSSNDERTNIEVAKLILNLCGRPATEITHVRDRLGHDKRYFMDSKKIKEEFRWKPLWEFEKGLWKTISSYD